MTGSESGPRLRPPRISSWLLDVCLPPGEHGQIIRGDLLEEFAARAAEESVPAARAWYRRQALSVAARYLVNPQKASLMDTLRQDIKYAVRSLAKSRGVTTAVLATLTIGIGAATAIFSVLHAVVIRPLPLPDADRLMFMTEYVGGGGAGAPRRLISISWPNFVDWRDRLTSFEGVATSRTTSFSIVDPEQPDRVLGRQATWNFMRVLGVSPVMGRDFSPEDDRPGAEGVVLIRYEYWQRQYGGAGDILGRTIRLNGRPRTIIGILPQGFAYARAAEVWEPLGQSLAPGSGTLDRGNHNGLGGIGRLKPGVTEQTARTELQQIAASLSREHPNTNSGITADLEPLATRIVGETRTVLWSLFAAVGCLLLVACVNVANLLVTRGASRRHELSLRAALGCGRLRLVRQLLVESLVLSLAGGVLGLAAGWGLLQALVALAPADTPRLAEVGLDVTAMLFALAAAMFSGLFFGLLPALSTSAVHGHELLRAPRTGAATTSARVRRTLIAVEVALAVVLLTGAGLTARTMYALTRANPGFDPRGVMTARVTVGGQNWSDDRLRAFVGDLLAELRRLPGVSHAAVALSLPIEGSQWGSVFIVGDKPVPARAALPSAAFSPVSDGYFEALQVRLIAGRFFTAQDTAASPRVVVVNQTAAARLWPGENAVGKRIKQGWPESETPWREVVGVAADLKLEGIDAATPMQIYLPFVQELMPNPALILRSSVDPATLSQPVREAVHRLAPSMPVYAVQTLQALMNDAVARERASMTIFGAFAVIAVVLASIGIYGIVAQSVTQRTHEVGVRVALGAGRGDVLRLFLRQGLVPVAVGLALGIPAALVLSRFIEDLLFDVTPGDQATLWTVAALLSVVAVSVCYVSARRATRIDAAVALRE